jgi:hypothetical protein
LSTPTAKESIFNPIRDLAEDSHELAFEKGLLGWFFAEESFIEYFETVEEPQSLPDLFGKSLLSGTKWIPSSTLTHSSGIPFPSLSIH